MSTATDGRNARWEAHRAERRRELVDAALTAIRINGPGVGMDEIAATAGTSKTVVYRHFTDRARLYYAVAERVDRQLMRDVGRSLAQVNEGIATHHGSTVQTVISAAIDAYLAMVERDPQVYRFIMTAPLVERPTPAEMISHVDSDGLGTTPGGMADRVVTLIEDAFASNGVHATQARTWAQGLVGMVRAVADDWCAEGIGITPRATLVHDLTELACGGVASLLPAREGSGSHSR